LDRHAGNAGPLHPAPAQAQNKLLGSTQASACELKFNKFTGVRAQQFAGAGIRRLAMPPGCAKKEERPTKRKKENKTMNGTVMQAVLWIVAGLFLTLLIIRRGKRKASKT